MGKDEETEKTGKMLIELPSKLQLTEKRQ